MVDAKSRRADWNKLGAGIGIQNSRGGACTTGGVAYKDTRYFLLTAGHCVDDVGDTVRQYYSNVGTSHMDAQSAGYDFGLVKVDKGSLTRYAFNGLYLHDDNNPSDYDGRLRNVAKLSTVDSGETLCKSGIKTGYTCGILSKRAANIWGEINFEVRREEAGFFAAQGDSGGPAFRSSNGYLIGVLSIVSDDYIATDDTMYGYRAYFAPVWPMFDRYNLSLYTRDTPTRILN